MITFTKAQLASILATAVDFLVYFFLYRTLGIWYLLSSATGTICGGITHFLVSRHWVFRAGEGKWSNQAVRYVLVWAGNLVLNTSVLYLLTQWTGTAYATANKIGIAVAVAIFYNYVLQKRFVFK